MLQTSFFISRWVPPSSGIFGPAIYHFQKFVSVLQATLPFVQSDGQVRACPFTSWGVGCREAAVHVQYHRFLMLTCDPG